MRLEWLEDILTINQTGSFSSAAERRNLTQSAFSRRIQQIEDYVGVQLFDRSRKPVQLRQVTQAQVGQIEEIAGLLRQLVIDLRRGDRAASNRIVIASQHSLTTSLSPRIIQGIRDRDEDVYVRLRSANLDECFALLLSRNADLAIVYGLEDSDPFAGDFLETIDLWPDQLVPVLRSDLAREVMAGTVSELPFVAYPDDVFFGTIMAERVLPALAGRAVAQPKAETALTIAALELAAAGVATAWVPLTLARLALSQGRITDLSPVLPSCPLSIRAVRLKGARSPAEEVIWNHIFEIQRAGVVTQ
ncbi:LysR family transcriptional regulator [Tabrizicola sp.]|uniref:LysR family transcriptional regulator n=1 Tax=Tabrizicola sp. TaxID=2005166 RepID=UPI002FDCD27E